MGNNSKQIIKMNGEDFNTLLEHMKRIEHKLDMIRTGNNIPEIMTVDQAAAILHIHPNQLRKLMSAGEIAFVQRGHATKITITRDALLAYMCDNWKGAPEHKPELKRA